MKVLGDVRDSICVIVDDMIDTAGTACKAAQVLKDAGALQVYMLACHGIFSNCAIQRIVSSQFDKIVVANTLDSQRYQDKILEFGCDNIEYLDVSWMCAEAMRRSHMRIFKRTL